MEALLEEYLNFQQSGAEYKIQEISITYSEKVILDNSHFFSFLSDGSYDSAIVDDQLNMTSYKESLDGVHKEGRAIIFFLEIPIDAQMTDPVLTAVLAKRRKMEMTPEKRLIEYDKVYEYAFDGVNCGNLENEDFDAIINAIDSVPTVDAVEVVHCKDCCFSQFFPESGSRKCRAQNGLHRTVEDNDFCSYGERKDYGQSKADGHE